MNFKLSTIKTCFHARRKDSLVLLQIMKKATGEEPVLLNNSIIIFGNKRYKSPTSGREVDWSLIGFAPGKSNISLYLMLNLKDHASVLEKLGKHKAGVGCICINKVEDINLDVLKGMVITALKPT